MCRHVVVAIAHTVHSILVRILPYFVVEPSDNMEADNSRGFGVRLKRKLVLLLAVQAIVMQRIGNRLAVYLEAMAVEVVVLECHVWCRMKLRNGCSSRMLDSVADVRRLHFFCSLLQSVTDLRCDYVLCLGFHALSTEECFQSWDVPRSQIL